MKAIQLHQAGSLDQLKYKEVKTPSAGAGQVLVKVVSSSVNFAAFVHWPICERPVKREAAETI